MNLPDIRLEKYESPPKGLVITVVSALKTADCHQCGQTIEKFHAYDKAITLRHLPIFEQPVWIHIKPKRDECPYCKGGPTTTQRCYSIYNLGRLFQHIWLDVEGRRLWFGAH